MKTQSGHITVAELCEQMQNRVIVANSSYQRAAGLWPNSAKSYFIDTILNEFPFQSVYIHEYVSRQARRVRKDIVDGQQRLTTIFEYLQDDFPLGTNNKLFPGKRYSQLPEDQQVRMLGYSIPVITITQSDTNEILEMFRRMNAFMVPLNPAEKRHSQFHGEFKWFINDLADSYAPMFNEFGVLTQKQIVRMADAELIADCADIVSRGLQNRSPAEFTKLYKKYDSEFPEAQEYREKLDGSFAYIRDSLSEISGTFANKSYVIHSLVAALLHNRWGIKANKGHPLEFEPIGHFSLNPDRAVRNILTLAAAHESRDEDGPYKDYVSACLSTTHRIGQRATRTKWMIRALRNEM